jgi:hypothetical protein
VRLTLLTIALLLLFLIIPVLLLVLREVLHQSHYRKKLKRSYADRELWRARLLTPKLEKWRPIFTENYRPTCPAYTPIKT